MNRMTFDVNYLKIVLITFFLLLLYMTSYILVLLIYYSLQMEIVNLERNNFHGNLTSLIGNAHNIGEFEGGTLYSAL